MAYTAEHITTSLEERCVQQAFIIRETEQALLDLFSQGKLYGTVHTCIGQEFTGVAVANALRDGDFIVSNHRGHGHYVAWTGDIKGLIAEVMGRETGVCGGRGGSQHLCSKGFYSNGIQGGIVPLATGMALAAKYLSNNQVGCVFIGDGTLGEGAVYESLNILSKFNLPLLVLIENNMYSQSTMQHESLAGSFEGRAEAFGIRSQRLSTWNWRELVNEVSSSVARIRSGGGPEICIVDTYRLMAHSKGDDNRDPDEVGQYRKRDPLNQLVGKAGAWVVKAMNDAKQQVADAVQYAEQSPFPSVLTRNVEKRKGTTWSHYNSPMGNARLVERIRVCLKDAMQQDDSIIMIGEDIRSPYGGAFKATQGLSDEFSDRVINSPISEQAIIGIGNGLALRGLRPFVEIMFGDFMILGFDQLLNHAAKFRYMYNDKVKVPLVIRTPMGGYRGYGPTHSQSLEKHFLGIPDTQVLAINSRTPIEIVYPALAATETPTLVCEYKVLYTRKPKPVPKGFNLQQSDESFPTIRLSPIGVSSDITMVGYGAMLDLLEDAAEILFDEHEIIAEIIAPTQLYPMNIEPFLESFKQTSKLLVVEEGQTFCGFGSELIASLSAGTLAQSARFGRVGPAPVPIPSSRALEELALPSVQDIVQKALELIVG